MWTSGNNKFYKNSSVCQTFLFLKSAHTNPPHLNNKLTVSSDRECHCISMSALADSEPKQVLISLRSLYTAGETLHVPLI